MWNCGAVSKISYEIRHNLVDLFRAKTSMIVAIEMSNLYNRYQSEPFTNSIPIFWTKLSVCRDQFESDVTAFKEKKEEEAMKKTKQVVRGILSRLALLLHVNITPTPTSMPLTRTMSHMQGGFQGKYRLQSWYFCACPERV